MQLEVIVSKISGIDPCPWRIVIELIDPVELVHQLLFTNYQKEQHPKV
jgi:hypothetical protein